MPKCKICGKDIKNPNSKNHIDSKFHQNKLIKLKDTEIESKISEIKDVNHESAKIKDLINSKFIELERILLKERIYNYIIRDNKVICLDLILYFQKFFNSNLINTLLIELYFEKLIDFEPKIPQEIEELLLIISKKIDLIFPLSIKSLDLEKIINERYLKFETIINKLKEFPEYIQFSSLSIGNTNNLIIFKNLWKTNSRIIGV